MISWNAFRELQRRAAANVDEWLARGRNVYTTDDVLVAECRDPENATRIVEHHNTFASICNMVVFLARKLKDARKVSE